MKIVSSFLYKISKPMTSATGVLYFGVILGFGITLNNFSEIATNAFHFYCVQGKILHGLLYWVIFSTISFLFSYIVFRLSFYIVDQSTEENEKVELTKNNFAIAALHAVVFVIICLVVSQPLTDLANSFVSYPKYLD